MRLLLICIVLALSLGCDNQCDADEIALCDYGVNSQDISNRSAIEVDVDQAKQLISYFGYNIADVDDKGEYYLVDKKYRFYKNDITAFILENPNYMNVRIAMSGNKMLDPHYRRINISSVYNAHDCDGYTYVSSAVKYWNNVGCDIQFNDDIGMSEHLDFPKNIYVEFTVGGRELIELSIKPSWDYQPHSSIHLNIDHYLWTIIINAGKGEELLTHALGEAIGLKNIDPSEVDDYMRANGNDLSIMFSPKVAGIGNHWNTNIWSMGISTKDQLQLRAMYPKTTIPDLTLSWNKEHGEDDDKYLLVNKYYTLSFTSEIDCCEGLSKTATIYKEDGSFVSTETTSGDSLELRFEKEGNYRIDFRVDDASLALPIHEQTLQVNVRNGFDWEDVEQVELSTPYEFRYYCEQPEDEDQNISINWSARECVFGDEDGEDFTMTTAGKNVVFTLNKNGCYLIRGEVSINNVPIDTVYCNITKMEKLPDNISIQKTGGVNMNYTPYTSSYYTNTQEILASYEYVMTLPTSEAISGRVGCLVESEYENRSWAIDSNCGVDSRKLNRCWLMRLNPVSWDNVVSSTEIPLRTLYWKNFTEEEQANGSPIWQYEYYTGRVYCPQDGIREVESMKLHELPLTCVSATMNESVVRMGFEYE